MTDSSIKVHDIGVLQAPHAPHVTELTLESARFECDAFRVTRLAGTSAISRLFSYDVEVTCLSAGPTAAEMLGEPVTIVITSPFAADEPQRIHGIVAEIDDQLTDGRGRRGLRLRVVPRAQRLVLGASQEVYLNQTVRELITAKLESVGLASGATSDVAWRLEQKYPAREIVVQYKETDLAFVCRLAEHVGISFFFDHGGDADRIVFTDFAGGFNLGRARLDVPFRGRGEKLGVWSLAVEHRMIPKSYTIHDYNYRLPQLAPLGSFQLPEDVGYAGDVIEEGTHARSPEEASFLARVRAEERQAGQLVYVGKSTVPLLQAGVVFRLTDHPELEGIDFLVVEVTHEAAQSIGGDGPPSSYTNTFRAISAARTYRPPRSTPKPRIYGVVSGLIDASLGGNSVYAPIDDQGRYHVRFFFDLTTPVGQVASSALRMIQNHAGASYGTHLPLKPGAEVLITFIDGDPDRPIIVGAAPNPFTPSPVVAANSDQHVIRTHSGTRIECK